MNHDQKRRALCMRDARCLGLLLLATCLFVTASFAQQANPMTTLQNFSGISVTSLNNAGIGAIPQTDASGAVGPNHYFQTTNFGFSIYDKKGNALPLNTMQGLDPGTSDAPVSLVPGAGPTTIASTSAFWTNFVEVVQLPGPGGTTVGGNQLTFTPCNGNWTDTAVLYDHAADRWVVIRFGNNPDAEGNTTWYMCFAVSQTGDPTGAYYRYAFPISQSVFPDYPKLAIWSDGYYITARMRVDQVSDTPVAAAPVPPSPSLQQTNAGSQPATYFVRNTCTYPNAAGGVTESAGSGEASLPVTNGNVLQVNSPTAGQCPGAVSWSTYVSTSQGNERLQTQQNLSIGTNWVQPNVPLGNTTRDIGSFVMAFDRAKMLNGDASAQMVLKTLLNLLDGQGNPTSRAQWLAADWDGQTPPPASSPEFLVRPFSDQLGWPSTTLQVYDFSVNWNVTPATGTVTATTTLLPGEFTPACGTNQFCIPQPASPAGQPPSQTLDPMSGVWGDLMYRLAYRNFGDHESLVLNHTVDVADNPTPNTLHVAPQWYELQRRGGDWSIFQQADYEPDGNHRWFGSIGMDQLGDMALGYSVTGTNPNLDLSIGFGARLAGDMQGTMSAETLIKQGSGVITQANPQVPFWVDFSTLTLDPTDDCTFWYVNSYQPVTSSSPSWNTQIASFRNPACPKAGNVLGYTGPSEGANGSAVNFSALLKSLHLNGIPIAEGNLTFTLGSQSCTAQTDFSGHGSCSIALNQPAGNYSLIVSFAGNDQFLPNSLSASFAIRIPWQPGVLYPVGTQVLFDGMLYDCLQTHTSQVGWEPPNVYSLWARDKADTGGVWATQVLYSVGDVVTFQGHTYKALQAHQSEPDWTPPATPALWQQIS